MQGGYVCLCMFVYALHVRGLSYSVMVFSFEFVPISEAGEKFEFCLLFLVTALH